MLEIKNFFGLEGLDGVGKTTARSGLSDLGYSVIKTPPDNFPIERSFYNDFGPNLRFVFYLMGVVMAGKQARELAAKGGVVFCDRYLLTTVAAHEAMGTQSAVISFFRPLMSNIEIPQNTFILTATEGERMKRMMARGANSTDLANLKINTAILDGYRKWSKKLGHGITEIDTTYILPSEVVRKIQSYI